MRQTALYHGLAAILMMLACSEAVGQFGGGLLQTLRDEAGEYEDEGDDEEKPAATMPEQGQSIGSATARRPAGPIRTKKERLASNAPDRYALIIAMREYPKSQQLAMLAGTDRDALRLAAVLKNGKYAESNIIVVYDDAPKPELRPTRTNIDRELNALLQRATEPSLVAVFVTGHGVSLAGESYICPGDATDAALTDAATAAKELLSVKDVATRLSKNCRAAHKMLVVDACRDTSNNRTSGYVKNVAALEKPAEGVWLMSSCSEGQFSWMSDRIRDGERHALFSHFIAEGLEGDADLLGNNDGEVGLFELYTYAFLKTRGAAKEINEKQTPELFGLASPFPVAMTGSFVSRRTLTTNDPQMEASRSAAQLADDVLVNLRAADREYRDTVSATNATAEVVQQSSRVLHRYLCHLLGNRIRAALELSDDCRLAWVARGLCYRTCGLYEQAFEAFGRGGEDFSLFIKAQPDMVKRYVQYDEEDEVGQDEEGNPTPRIEKAAGHAIGYAYLYEKPGDEKPKFSVKRQQKVRITKMQGPWLYVDAIDDRQLVEGGWIHRDEVHWFPEAIDLYTPASPMRPWDGGAANRLDYAADNLSELAERLAQPAERIHEGVERLSEPIDELNGILGRIPFAPSLPNPIRRYGGMAESYARIPSNYVAMGSNYARMPANYARMARQWAGAADVYYAGHQQEEKVGKSRKKLENAGQLEPVKERPILLIEVSWPNNKK
jgi:hypothetical protein